MVVSPSLRPILPSTLETHTKDDELEISRGVLWTWREVLLVPGLWILEHSSNLLPHHPDRGVSFEVDYSHSRRIPCSQQDAFNLLGSLCISLALLPL